MTIEELEERATAEQARQRGFKKRVLTCTSAGCVACGAAKVVEQFRQGVKDGELAKDVEVVETGCMGLCGDGPLVRVAPDDTLYSQVVLPTAKRILDEDLVAGRVVEDHRVDPAMPFFARQVKVVLQNCGRIDAEKIEGAMAVGGYEALAKALTEMKPEEAVEEVRKSGLRGRGGAGYPTGLKWSIVRKAQGDQKYVVCNADEGDPGAFMDRSVLEGDPHRVLEGMAIAGYATGASQGYIYIRAEYPLAIERLRTAIKQAERLGLLGNRILESSFSFRIDIRIGAGAFVCGEETALMRSIQGRRGRPRPRPPYPSEKGLWGMPTLINNVETYANIVPIIQK
ncbi:MAG: NAD(P)H-dependent oxidoreductase subunit E, partial [Bacteroidota bacterium]